MRLVNDTIAVTSSLVSTGGGECPPDVVVPTSCSLLSGTTPLHGNITAFFGGGGDGVVSSYDDVVDFDVVDNSTRSSAADNLTSQPDDDVVAAAAYTTFQLVVLGVLAGSTSLVTVCGNLVVILSFVVERSIRQPTNYFIASLAVSDLIIGSISMPFYTVYLLAGQHWPLGEVVCDIWLSIDYTVCLCSIYTVFCITIDR